MEKSIVPFMFGENHVRVRMDDSGNPWFVAKDVARALEYPEASMNSMLRLIQNVPEEWRTLNPIQGLNGTEREGWFLSESGLYFFLGRSDKPKALPFQKWLAGEVLPALRKTGQYTMPKAEPAEETRRGESDPLFSPAVLRLETNQRIRLLEQSVSTAREEGWGVHEMEDYFLRLCEMAGSRRPNPKRSKVRRFIAQCLTHVPGENLPFMRIYAAFYDWWEANEKGAVPGSKTLATELRRYFSPLKSSVSHFRDCALCAR